MTLGGAKDFAVYVRNEGNQTCFLNVKTASWQPSTAVNCLNFSWSCGINKFEIGKVAKGTLSLRIPLTTTGISTFSFDIIFEGTDRLIGDVNGDGFVGIDDIFHIGTQVGKPDYDPTCDINNDGSVTMEDIFLAAQHYGEEAR
jgi:TM2 domain-containing membrane protein YozV